jgi:glycosyltransferase involved in cell wall biosynthesis
MVNDTRAIRLLASLSKRYSVVALGWNRENVQLDSPMLNRSVSFRWFKKPAPYGSYRVALLYPLFWIWVLGNLFSLMPRMVHACDFDAVVPSIFYKLFSKSKVAFDSFDRIAMAFIPTKKRVLFSSVNFAEDLMASASDLLITVSMSRLYTFRYLPKKYRVILNCPSRLELQKMSGLHLADDNCFLAVYTGQITSDRGLELLGTAITHFKDSRLVVAGRPINRRLLKWLKGIDCVRYLGILSHDDALAIQAQSDVIPILYDPDIPINRVASPNKLFEAMMLGVPVIANVCPEIIKRTGCGLLASFDTSSVVDSLRHLKESKDLRSELGNNGREAFLSKYNWEIMEQRLLDEYATILS